MRQAPKMIVWSSRDCSLKPSKRGISVFTGLGEEVKSGHRPPALLRALDDIVEVGVDEVGDGPSGPLQREPCMSHAA